MNLINQTPYLAEHTTATDKTGRLHLLLVLKATWRLPLGGEPAQLMAEQMPPVLSDTATGEPGLSAPEYECDFVLHKPRCEVLLLGSAYPPHGTPANVVDCGFRVGELTKVIRMHGPRQWVVGITGVRPGKAQPFVRQPISYDLAFGGIGHHTDDAPAPEAIHLHNPVGIGYQTRLDRAWLHGKPMPQTEAVNQPVLRPNQPYAAMSFGPIGRHWAQRACFAGTYDANWQENIFPFLPPDFDERYFQSAPPDQQLNALQGGQSVILMNLTHPALTPAGRLDFVLPNLALTAQCVYKSGVLEEHDLRADTLLLEPDKQRFCVVWRLSLPLRRNVTEIEQIAVGLGAKPTGAAACCDAHNGVTS
jgi:hypothetical protein